ncbi:PREDICTED: uncharacterized protein LOC106806706 isoform X1 [Priapulus caudatus]|uniref:Uncharacterized protein LOC106806706 isoform X1 n=1 Tax=Priapulus caudatus TaxID=37621 RepID=A0ABM1DW88_PRICU|nr:PREDICTED: uncharacterized protein LOC106806706 isoform X1 [Priapulus caudatus]
MHSYYATGGIIARLPHVLLFWILFTEVQSLQCYQCENVHSNGECNGTLYLDECASTHDTCQTMVTWSGEIHKLLITKSCTKELPCYAQRNESNISMPCKYTLDTWSCVTCCHTDRCNEDVATSAAQYLLRYAQSSVVTTMLFLVAVRWLCYV